MNESNHGLVARADTHAVPTANWPTSKPDYAWPPRLRGPGYAAGRVAGAVVFHLCYVVGLVLSFVIRSRPAALVIRTDGIGDAILFEPALEALARSLSPHDLHLWAPAATCELLAACPVVRKRVVIPRGFKDGNLLVLRVAARGAARLGFTLGFRPYEIAIYPAESPEPLGNWLLLSRAARVRWVNYGDTINQFDWQRTKVHANVTRVLSQRPGLGTRADAQRVPQHAMGRLARPAHAQGLPHRQSDRPGRAAGPRVAARGAASCAPRASSRSSPRARSRSTATRPRSGSRCSPQLWREHRAIGGAARWSGRRRVHRVDHARPRRRAAPARRPAAGRSSRRRR